MDKRPEVLIVEENKIIASAFMESIQEELEVDVTMAASQADVIKLFEEEAHFALAIVNLQVPENDPGAAVRLITEHDVPTIILTGASETLPEDLQKNASVMEYVPNNDTDSIDYVTKVAKKLIKNLEMTIMVVDDSKTQLELFKESLRLINITRVVTAEDGTEALKLLEESGEKPTMVITDYMMPNMDGMRLVEAIRKKYNKDTLSIIALSATDDRSLPSEFLRLGANDFVSKPYEEREFQTRINNNLEISWLFEENRRQKEKLQEIAFTDSQTKIYNRTKYMMMVKRYCQLYQRSNFVKNGPGLYNIHIYMKGIGPINKKYGYAKGDQVLQSFVKLIEPLLGENDTFYRVMSTEFSIISPKSNYAYVKDLSDRIMQTLTDHTRSDQIQYRYSITQYDPKNKVSSFAIGTESL